MADPFTRDRFMIRRATENLHLVLLLSSLAFIGLVYVLSPILQPFLAGLVLAYISNPLVERLHRLKVPRPVGTTLVLILFALAFLLFVLIITPLLIQQFHALSKQLPFIFEWLRHQALPWVNQQFKLSLSLDVEALRQMVMSHSDTAREALSRLLPSITSSGLFLLGFLSNLLLVPLVFFYFLRDWPRLVVRLNNWIPRRWNKEIQLLAQRTDAVLGEFLRGQLSVMLLMSGFYSCGLWLAGLEFALPIGILTGLLGFVPYVGVGIGILLGTVAAILQYGEWSGIWPIWLAFACGQVLEGMFLTPWLVGERIGLHPVAVIFALLAFGQLFGFAGLFLALPASAALLVWLRYLEEHYFGSQFYQKCLHPLSED